MESLTVPQEVLQQVASGQAVLFTTSLKGDTNLWRYQNDQWWHQPLGAWGHWYPMDSQYPTPNHDQDGIGSYVVVLIKG